MSLKSKKFKTNQKRKKFKNFCLLREIRMRENTMTTDTEHTQDQCECVSGMTDLEREIPETGRESDKDPKKHAKIWRVFESLKIGKKQRKKTERTEECKRTETAIGEENVEMIQDTVTDQKISEDLPKNSEDE